MADKQITQFQLTDQFTMDNFNQRIVEINTALESINAYTKQQIAEINTALKSIDVYTKAQTLSDATKLKYGLNSDAIPDNVFERLSHFTPTGAVFWLASETIPEGFLLCDGSSVSRTQYPALFAVIGTTFGSNDATTFKLPDLRAKFVRGAGTSNGYSATFGATQEATAEIPSAMSAPLNYDKEGTYSTGSYVNGGDTGNPSSREVYSMRPYNIALTPIIKYI